jgi:hypothetical protein
LFFSIEIWPSTLSALIYTTFARETNSVSPRSNVPFGLPADEEGEEVEEGKLYRGNVLKYFGKFNISLKYNWSNIFFVSL